MTYPGGATYPVTEWLIDGVWTDLSDRVRGDVDIRSRGRQNEQGTISPTTADTVMDDADEELANRNPRSAWFRKIPAGTQIRHRAGDGDNHLFMRYNTISIDKVSLAVDDDLTSVRSPDKAAFDIVGDLEVRVDVRPHTWRPSSRVMILASKYLTTGNQRSWLLYLNSSGAPVLNWSPDGTAAAIVSSTATVSVPATTGRLSIKATLDVNNGAAGNTVRFYTATTIGGSYTQLGADVVTAGVTSVFSSTAAVVLGGGEALTPVFSNGVGFGGRMYGMHLYNSAGTRVADPDFTLWDIDDTAVADPAGNTWTVSGQARITSPRIRFWGELASAEHVTDLSSTDITVNVQAADLTQALGSPTQKVSTPLTLNIGPRPGLLGWWPFEDLEDASQAANSVAGARPASPVGAVTFGQSSDLLGTSRVAVLPEATSMFRFVVKKGTNTGFWQTIFLFKVSALPASESILYALATGGTARYVRFAIGASTFRFTFLAADGVTVLATSGVSFGTGVVVADEWIAMRIQLAQNGANIDWAAAWYQQGSPTFWGTSGSFAGTSVSQPTNGLLYTSGAAEFVGMQVAHLLVSEVDTGFANTDQSWSNAINAYDGERAALRIRRVAELAGIYVEVTGDVWSSAALGPQPIAKPWDVFLDAQKTDGGFLFGLRDAYGLGYRTRQDLERHIDATIAYTGELVEVPKILDDGAHIVNDYTATRTGGSSAQAEISDGPTSVATAPDGVGRRPGGDTFNVETDAVLPGVANLRARQLSFDGPAIPNLAVAFHDREPVGTHPSTTVGAELVHVDLGATVAVTGWPTHLPPERVLFLVQGYAETLGRYLWSMRMNTTPGGPYRMGMWSIPSQAAGTTRWGSRSSVLDAGVTSTATTIVVAGSAAVSTVEVWTTVSARYPLDVMIGGEQITLTQAPGGATSPQTFANVTRSVNGIVRAHDAGEPVRLFSPTYYGLRS